MANYTDLGVWKEARVLNRQVNFLTRKLPKYEQYGMSDQMRRAVVSIGSNIAEGRGRGTVRDFLHFLYVARGSAYELGTQLTYCQDVGYIDEEAARPIHVQLRKVTWMLHQMIESLKNKLKTQGKTVGEDVEEYED